MPEADLDRFCTLANTIGLGFNPVTRPLVPGRAGVRRPRDDPQPDRPHGLGAVVALRAFGHGPHHCLGAALARAELQVALDVLSRRITCPVLAEGATWRPPVGITGPDRLPVTFTAR